MPTGRVLIVEADPSIRAFVSMALLEEGYTVAEALTCTQALPILNHFRPNLILLDMQMRSAEIQAFVNANQSRRDARAPIILFSAWPVSQEVIASLDIDLYLPKPFELDGFLDSVASLIQTSAE